LRLDGEERIKGDQRILGDTGFVLGVLKEAEEKFLGGFRDWMRTKRIGEEAGHDPAWGGICRY
jgi:hypothetical protein